MTTKTARAAAKAEARERRIALNARERTLTAIIDRATCDASLDGYSTDDLILAYRRNEQRLVLLRYTPTTVEAVQARYADVVLRAALKSR